MSNTQKPYLSDNGVAVLSGLIKGATDGKANADLSNVDLEVLAARVNEAGISGGGLEGGLYVDENGVLYFDSKPVSGGGAMSEEVETRFSTVEGDLDTVEGKVSTLETDVAGLKQTTTGLSNTISGVDTKATTNAQNITSLTSRVSAVETAASNAASAAAAAQTKANTNANNITSLTSRVAAVEGKVPIVVDTTIGTSWTTDSTTGAKYQTITVTGATAARDARVGVRFASAKTAAGFTEYANQRNQFNQYICNGFAETGANTVTFWIFGDANTINIPITVEVI